MHTDRHQYSHRDRPKKRYSKKKKERKKGSADENLIKLKKEEKERYGIQQFILVT